MLTEAALLNCAGWKALNRIAPLGNIHNVFFQNWLELQNLLAKIHEDVNVSKSIQKEAFEHLQQKIFNYLAASSVLTDTTRKVLNHYKETDLLKEYEQKVSDLFRHNNLCHFVRNLRNYQTHYELTFPCPVRSLDDGIHWDVVLLSADLLKHKEEWKQEAKQFIMACGEEINLNKIFTQYANIVNIFYTWLYTKFVEYHKEDLEERDQLINELKVQLPSSPLNQLPLTSAQCEEILAKLQKAE